MHLAGNTPLKSHIIYSQGRAKPGRLGVSGEARVWAPAPLMEKVGTGWGAVGYLGQDGALASGKNMGSRGLCEIWFYYQNVPQNALFIFMWK